MANGISARIQSWRDQLLDTSKRNRLIHFRTGRGGGVPLLYPDPADLWQRLVADDKPVTFAWQRDLLDLPEEPADEAEGPFLLPEGAPAVAAAPRAGADPCRSSPRLLSYHVLTELSDRQLASRLLRLSLAARESLTEQGVTTLFVAFGFLRWFESSDSTEEVRSPLLLVPVQLG